MPRPARRGATPPGEVIRVNGGVYLSWPGPQEAAATALSVPSNSPAGAVAAALPASRFRE